MTWILDILKGAAALFQKKGNGYDAHLRIDMDKLQEAAAKLMTAQAVMIEKLGSLADAEARTQGSIERLSEHVIQALIKR